MIRVNQCVKRSRLAHKKNEVKSQLIPFLYFQADVSHVEGRSERARSQVPLLRVARPPPGGRLQIQVPREELGRSGEGGAANAEQVRTVLDTMDGRTVTPSL